MFLWPSWYLLPSPANIHLFFFSLFPQNPCYIFSLTYTFLISIPTLHFDPFIALHSRFVFFNFNLISYYKSMYRPLIHSSVWLLSSWSFYLFPMLMFCCILHGIYLIWLFFDNIVMGFCSCYDFGSWEGCFQ